MTDQNQLDEISLSEGEWNQMSGAITNLQQAEGLAVNYRNALTALVYQIAQDRRQPLWEYNLNLERKSFVRKVDDAVGDPVALPPTNKSKRAAARRAAKDNLATSLVS